MITVFVLKRETQSEQSEYDMTGGISDAEMGIIKGEL